MSKLQNRSIVSLFGAPSSGGGGGSGDVTGPAISTSNALARFNGTTGEIIKDSPDLIFGGGTLRINAAVLDTSAILQMDSTTRGILQPRMSTAQRDAISAPTAGLGLYNAEASAPEYFNGANWVGYEASSATVYVRSIADLPAPIGSVITLVAGVYYRLLNNVNTEGNRIAFSSGSRMVGLSSTTTSLIGTTTGPLVSTDGAGGILATDMCFTQEGSGELITLETTNFLLNSFFNRCDFSGGAIRLISGPFAGFSQARFSGIQLIQDGGGGIEVMAITENSVFLDLAPIDGLLVFESGSTMSNLVLKDLAFILLDESVGIRVEQNASILVSDVLTSLYRTSVANSTAILLENPDNMEMSVLGAVSFEGPGVYNGANPMSSSNFAAPDADPRDVGFDGTNLISCDPSTAVNASVFRHTGVSASIGTTLVDAVFTGIRGVAWARGKLVTILNDGNPGTIQIHDGFSAAVDTSFASPGNNPVGIAFGGIDLISLDATTGVVSIHDGQTGGVIASFASPAGTTSSGITYDGINLLISDSTNNLIYVMEGVTAVVQYSFPGPGTLASGVTITDVGAVVSDGTATATLYVFDHTLTFDHSSKTWAFVANTGDVIDSADRGGSQFEDESVSISVVQNEWTDVAGAGIFHSAFTRMEKCRLNDELNGEVFWTGARIKGRILSAQVVITRGLGGATGIFYEVAIVINGVVQNDGKGVAVLDGNNTFATLVSVPITRDITEGDLIKVQIRNVTNTIAPEVSVCKLAIN